MGLRDLDVCFTRRILQSDTMPAKEGLRVSGFTLRWRRPMAMTPLHSDCSLIQKQRIGRWRSERRRAESPAKCPGRVTIERLAGYPLVTYDSGFSSRNRIDQAFADAGLKPDLGDQRDGR